MEEKSNKHKSDFNTGDLVTLKLNPTVSQRDEPYIVIKFISDEKVLCVDRHHNECEFYCLQLIKYK
jgi:hypothetical protein